MTNRIRITDLRALTEHQAPANETQASIILALLDAVEAAHDWHELAQYGEAPDAVDLRLIEALGRFDFGDDA